MNLSRHPDADSANLAAADLLAGWLVDPAPRNLMLAGGNTPLELYRLIGERRLPLPNLTIFALDEYVGVPRSHPRNTANLLRRAAVEAWGVANYHCVISEEADALESVQSHERKINEAGGLDAIVLGLGQNGHLGFNEPGSEEDSAARVLDLDPISIEANRKWFGGDYAPARGATVGMKTILAARRVMVMAYGSHKTDAVRAMVQGPRSPRCPASLLQGRPQVSLILDEAAAMGLAPC